MGRMGTSITVSELVRQELLLYKGQDGLTYDEAITRPMETAGWIEDQNNITEASSDD